MSGPPRLLRAVGGTGLRLPPLGFGAAHVGGREVRIDGRRDRETLQAAWDGGLRYFDTAPWYGRGLSEHRVGDFLTDQPRGDFVLTTKVGRVFRRPTDPGRADLAPWAAGLRFDFAFDYTSGGVLRSYEQSLMRLGLDTVDALLVHDPDPTVHGVDWEGRMRDLAGSGIRALEALKRAGEIQAIGMGLNTAEALDLVPQMVALDFVLVAMAYTLLDQSALAALDRLAAAGVGVVIGAPFASDILVTGATGPARYGYRPASPAILEKTARIAAVCARHGVALPAAALRFPLGHPAVVSVIPGGASPDEVGQIGTAFAADIPGDLWQELRAEGLIDARAPLPG